MNLVPVYRSHFVEGTDGVAGRQSEGDKVKATKTAGLEGFMGRFLFLSGLPTGHEPTRAPGRRGLAHRSPKGEGGGLPRRSPKGEGGFMGSAMRCSLP